MQKKIIVPATIDSLEAVQAFLEACCEEIDCPMKTQMQLAIAVEELFVNIAHYAYPHGAGEASVDFSYAESERSIRILFSDAGIPYNPLMRQAPDTTLSADNREIGGLGILMVRKSMDEMRYAYEEKQNRLTIVKKL